MKQKETGIPISPSLNAINNHQGKLALTRSIKNRLLYVSALSVLVAIAISIIAKGLIYLINIVTNLSFYGMLDVRFHSPAANHLGLWVIIVPAIGGVIVGLMALYGSKVIRGHGIPEAMEQILTNQSKIKPSITFLKPISSAIAIGTGGPFGAEGPIIATGGALGSTLGQLLKITANERKVILAAGATAGMSAIFGTPIAAVLLAIELLLFEFSPKSILPVALACITGAAGHHLLFESGPVFPMPNLTVPTNGALAIYSGIGLIIGFLSLGITKIVYLIEDWFDKLPIHWMWWPALGGLAVGVIGYFAPHTLGVGYDNIISILSGTIPLLLVLRLCFFKFLSWAIALGSGTSGGTLAPLLTIGGAAGAIIGAVILMLFPNSGITIPMAALLGMSSMFAGASRAYLTSITFALESTMQSNALLPLLGACTASYLVSFFLMENTIMTEKIARRGVATPVSFEPDVLSKLSVFDVMNKDAIVLSADNPVSEVKAWLLAHNSAAHDFIVVDKKGDYIGTFKLGDMYNTSQVQKLNLGDIVHPSALMLTGNTTLRLAAELMAKHEAELVPVTSAENKIIGSLSYKEIIAAYGLHNNEADKTSLSISLKRQRLKIMSKGRKLMNKDSDARAPRN
ncbi:chloride channel protein [Mucilaginibacter ginsenosidivorax]|uniref:Chloride channel protein n=1 Tax=Mucilaginibacter ginsenosidivorax TaxID=862126 RepID=A0A5B8W060_9SPHI|nr:chloride channel protein [Mucilaginibacter ginsenosidivorax]QEC77063.1 chloride channel protein [Mucilaginibacter ginsenosidivorax]